MIKNAYCFFQRSQVTFSAFNRMYLQLEEIWCPLLASLDTALMCTNTYTDN